MTVGELRQLMDRGHHVIIAQFVEHWPLEATNDGVLISHAWMMTSVVFPGSKPHRDESNRWHVPVEEWPWETYPAWAHGAGYVITKDLVNEIAAGAAMKIQNHTLFRLEDISMGAWVEFVGKEKGWYVQLVKDRRFNFNGCSGKDLVSHYIQAQQMYCMYTHNGQCCENGLVGTQPILNI